MDVDGYVEWTDAVRATLRRRAPGLRNDAGTRSDVRGSGDSGSAAASASSTTTRPRVVVVPDPPRIACDERGCGGGACNRELGACRCPLSLDGARCETFAPARCDEDPASPRELVGVEYKSRCAGECDLTAAKCRCGRGVAHLDAGDLRNAHPDWKLPNDVAANGTAYAGPYAPTDAPMSKFPERPMQGCYYEGIATQRTWHAKLDWDRAAGGKPNDFWRPRDDPGPRSDWCAWEPGRGLLQPRHEAEVVHRDEEEVGDLRVVRAVRGIQQELVQRNLGAVEVILEPRRVTFLGEPRHALSDVLPVLQLRGGELWKEVVHVNERSPRVRPPRRARVAASRAG